MSRWRWLLGGNDDDCVERHTSTPNEKNDIKEEEEIPLLLVFPDDAIGKGKKTTSRKKCPGCDVEWRYKMSMMELIGWTVTAARRCRPLLPTVSVEPILERMRLSW